ncbi:MAG TPA: histidine kinase [Actinomycetes bacterium]|nr:histidine kinase [Actinomycetes bacterium]
MSRHLGSRLDVAIAVVVVVAGWVEFIAEDIQPRGVALTMATLAGASLAFRRRWPLLVVVVCFGALAIDTWAGVPLSQPVTPMAWVLLSQYSVARESSIRQAIAGLVLGLGIFATTLAKDSSDLLFGLIIIGTPWLVGLAMRSRVAETNQLAERAADLERRRDEEAQAAVAAERRRIARDLHDVIAHTVSVMVVQAGAAAEVLKRDPAQAEKALRNVQDTGRAALTEMSTLLGVLRENGEEVGLAPQPGLKDLDSLLEQTRTAGLPVRLVVTGEPRELPAGVELSLYRVVQEALTNTRKHAGEASATVEIAYGTGDVRLAVTDDGTATTNGYGGQQGILGMRERVAIYGGELDAGPGAAGGYAVRARIPVPA